MASRVWDLVLDSGVVPDAWARGRTVLLFKPNGKTRPLTILPLIWRAGARCLNCKLKAWCDSWRSHRDAGGLPATSVGHALQQLQLALNKGMVAAVQQDVAGYFDCLEHHLVDRVLRHLRAPPGMVSVLADFYQKGQRIFKLEGALGSSWRRPTRGIPQGCPFSPVISAALTHIWSVFVVGLGFRVWGLEFRVWGLGFGVWGLRFGVGGFGFRWIKGYRVLPVPISFTAQHTETF